VAGNVWPPGILKFKQKPSTMTQEQVSRLTSGITGEFQSNFIEEKGGAVEAVTFLLAKIDRLESNMKHLLSNPKPSVNDDLTDALEGSIHVHDRETENFDMNGTTDFAVAVEGLLGWIMLMDHADQEFLKEKVDAARAALDKAKGVTQNQTQ